MSGRSEWGAAIQEEQVKKRRRRWRVEISEHDRMLIVLKLERLTPQERTPNEKALMEFLESLPEKDGDGKTLHKKPLRKGRKLANRAHNRRKTAAEAARLLAAHERRVAAAERKKARTDRKKKADKQAKKITPIKKPTSRKRSVNSGSR